MVDKVAQAAARSRFQERMAAQGRRRVELWIRADQVAEFQEAARTGHGLARLRREALADVRREVRKSCAAELRRRTRKALLVQARKEARAVPAGANAPPSRVRFGVRPPMLVRWALRELGWRYDPVAAVWIVPQDDPATWDRSLRVLGELERMGGLDVQPLR